MTTPGQIKMAEFAACVAEHSSFRDLLGDKRHGLHNCVLAGLYAVYDGCLPSDEREMIRRLDATMATIKRMVERS